MIRSFSPIPAEPSPNRILGQLYPPGPARSTWHARSEELAAEASAAARELIRPAGVFGMTPAEDTAPWPPTARGEFLFVGLATLGSDLDEACRGLRAEGKDTQALFLDAAGAVAVETACEFLDDEIGSECRQRKIDRTQRASPGYGAFPLEDQRRLFDLLPAKELGVELTAECMMIPLKSVSFVIMAGKYPQLIRADLTCDVCGLVNCPDRSSSHACVYREDDP